MHNHTGTDRSAHSADALTLHTVKNDHIELTFLPGVGGRMLSLRLDGTELLWVNPGIFTPELDVLMPREDWPEEDGTLGSWTNPGGSKTWPAPQGSRGDDEWAGPADSVLDSGAWAFQTAHNARAGATWVRMQSAPDEQTGLQITREFTIPDRGTTFDQVISFYNHGTQPVQWAIWEGCQVDTTGSANHPIESAGIDVGLLAGTPSVDLGQYVDQMHEHVEDGQIRIPITAGVNRRGFPGASGTLTYRRPDGIHLTMSTEAVAAAPYPDQGSRAEVWLQSPTDAPVEGLAGFHPDAWLTELGLLSPLRTIRPGRSSSMTINWTLGRQAK